MNIFYLLLRDLFVVNFIKVFLNERLYWLVIKCMVLYLFLKCLCNWLVSNDWMLFVKFLLDDVIKVFLKW